MKSRHEPSWGPLPQHWMESRHPQHWIESTLCVLLKSLVCLQSGLLELKSHDHDHLTTPESTLLTIFSISFRFVPFRFVPFRVLSLGLWFTRLLLTVHFQHHPPLTAKIRYEQLRIIDSCLLIVWNASICMDRGWPKPTQQSEL